MSPDHESRMALVPTARANSNWNRFLQTPLPARSRQGRLPPTNRLAGKVQNVGFGHAPDHSPQHSELCQAIAQAKQGGGSVDERQSPFESQHRNSDMRLASRQHSQRQSPDDIRGKRIDSWVTWSQRCITENNECELTRARHPCPHHTCFWQHSRNRVRRAAQWHL